MDGRPVQPADDATSREPPSWSTLVGVACAMRSNAYTPQQLLTKPEQFYRLPAISKCQWFFSRSLALMLEFRLQNE
eukprot:Skav236618  [mRNA]  locus=scaffold1476:311862:312271:- [translate_table: standard]